MKSLILSATMLGATGELPSGESGEANLSHSTFSLKPTRFQMKSAVFSASYNLDDTYDAYERDIALVSFYFEQSTVFEYARLERGSVTFMWKL